MECSYRKLRGRIVEKYDSQRNFAKAVDLSDNSMSKKMTGKVEFSREDIRLWCDLLDIRQDEIGEYFFPDICK